jgi:hypothetical protein
MRRIRWRELAFALTAATLSLGIAACDDDTSKLSTDMAMNSNIDMSATVDMAMGTPGNGQVTLADVVGTVFSPAFPGGAAPRTHTLLALASLPVLAGTPDPSSDFGLTPTIHGCSVYRYNATNLPGADGDGGTVTISGFNSTSTLAFDKNGSTVGPPKSPIGCVRIPPPAGVNSYVCFYPGMGSPDSGADGMPTSDVIYPMIPHKVVTGPGNPAPLHTPISTIAPPQGWPFGDGTCNPRYIPNSMDPSCANPALCQTNIELCEQEPILPLGVATITEHNTGGTDYPAKTSMLGDGSGLDGGAKMFPGPLYVTDVKQGTTSIVGTDPITGGPSLSLAAAIDKTKDLVITFSCDPNNSTPGTACAGSGDLTALLIKTSTSVKAMFGTSTASGVAQCAQPVAAPGGTITVKAAQITALLGGQTGGSIQLALARLAVDIQPDNGHLLVFTAGMGTFGFTDE